MGHELPTEVDDNELDTYFESVFHEEENCGFLKLSFQVRLDPSFAEVVEKLRIQRLENLETIVNENQSSLKEQLNYLKASVGKDLTIFLIYNESSYWNNKSRRKIGFDERF